MVKQTADVSPYESLTEYALGKAYNNDYVLRGDLYSWLKTFLGMLSKAGLSWYSVDLHRKGVSVRATARDNYEISFTYYLNFPYEVKIIPPTEARHIFEDPVSAKRYVIVSKNELKDLVDELESVDMKW